MNNLIVSTPTYFKLVKLIGKSIIGLAIFADARVL